ncbi:hypothetical protein [Gordonia alkanivorans]|uniref:hypothetical protein n=1 Tax=Gordonia alkanivorans TaxID=84096 RepID=UPI0024B7D9EE|nr:hypothetical protein [Gordonia alkanivorans]MDJ0010084.1 hypothetical protein [Gordonia alkanivorans]MDJ0495726.1 hypothetical protein [Gordonia alkanivorans]
MTTPNLPISTPADQLPQGVVPPSALGSATQDHSKAKYRTQAASRFPSQVNDTMAGNPANTSGPLGIINDLAAGLTANVANADPATIKKPSDLLPQATPFFSGLPLQKVFQLPLRILAGIIGGIPIIGDAVEDALAGWLLGVKDTADDAAESVVSVGTQVNYVQQVISLQSGMGVWETGPDRTGTPSFPFGLLNLPVITVSHDLYFDNDPSTYGMQRTDVEGTITALARIPTVAVTATSAPWSTVIFKSAAERKVLSWIAYKTGTVSTFHLDLYKLEEDGSTTFTGYSSPNLAGEVPVSLASIGWMQHLMDGASIVADLGEVYEVQFRMTGSGTVFLAGANFLYPVPLPGFRPYSSGSRRDPSTTPTPATIPTTTRDAMYTGPCPFVSIGIDVGQTAVPRFFFDDFNRSSLGTRWIRYGDIGISNNKVAYTGSVIANATAAMMHHQPLATDIFEAGADVSIDEEDIGIGIGCTSGLTSGVWLIVEDDGVSIDSGAYNSRTVRTPVIAPPGSGRYTLRRIRSEDDTHFLYQAYLGDPNATEPILTWADTGGLIAGGSGRRWLGLLARRNGLINPSGSADNWTAADISVIEP